MKQLLAVGFFLVLILGIRLYLHSVHPAKYQPNTHVEITGIIWNEPQRYGQIQKVKVDDVVFVLPEYPRYEYGQKLSLSGILEENTFTSKSGEEVTELVVNNPEIRKVSTPIIIGQAAWMRSRIITVLTRVLPVDEAALLLGVTLGVRTEFSDELLDTFTQTGILHVVAASGSNVAIVAGVMLFSLERVTKRKISILSTGAAILWYALLAGFDPAIIRASLMAVIALTAQLLGRQRISYFILLLTIWIMVMVSPDIWKNVGFLLSVSATGGIITLKPYFDHLFRRAGFIKDDLGTTIAAQWGSLPILVGTFGNFAPLSLIVNLAVLWVVPLIMILGLLSSFGAIIYPSLAMPFAYMAYPFLFFFLAVVKASSYFVESISIIKLSPLISISYYFISISIILYLKLNHVKS